MKKDRIVWLDFARAFAIVSVVAMHCIESVYNLSLEKLQALPVMPLTFRAVFYTFGRLGVPIFVMLSGYLLLSRDYSTDKKILSFYKHNLLPLILTAEIWVVIYFIWKAYLGELEPTADTLLMNMLFLKVNEYSHMWYIPMIIGIYIALPFVANAVKNISSKTLLIPISVFFVFYYILNLKNLSVQIFGEGLEWSRRLEIGFLGGIYGSYLIAGFLRKRGAFRKIPTVLLCLGSVISFAFCVVTIIVSVKNGYNYNIWYDFVGIFICTVCLFELFGRIKFQKGILKKAAPLFTTLSVISLGIFFIHKPLLDFIREYIINFGFSRSISFIVLFVIVFSVSALAAFVISKIPKVRKWLILVK